MAIGNIWETCDMFNPFPGEREILSGAFRTTGDRLGRATGVRNLTPARDPDAKTRLPMRAGAI